jgi:hypothetical protein
MYLVALSACADAKTIILGSFFSAFSQDWIYAVELRKEDAVSIPVTEQMFADVISATSSSLL